MLQLVEMQIESARFAESVEQIYARVFRAFKPRTALPQINIRFRKYANANSRVRLHDGRLTVDISDLLEGAPPSVQEALASILIAKLFRKELDSTIAARYRTYLNRPEVRRTLHLVQQERGRKVFRDPRGKVYDLCRIFNELNFRYFYGLMAQPDLGWSLRPSRTTLGHYDPSHNAIVLTMLLDCEKAPELLVRFVMFHEMLHLKYPTEHRRDRRCVHTKEFKQAEKAFENFREAKAELKRFVERLAANG